MGDDGYSGVNLNFAFPYYDKSFNQAYMYDNGVLSFIQPGQPNALSPWQWYSSPVNQANAKYFIAPLWADIAPVSQTTYTTSGTSTSQKFTWNNIAEYYSRGGVLRLNTFSVELNSNGDIATKYYGLNLRTSNISIGYKGDTEYTQVAYNPYGYVLSTQADWTANTKVAPPAPVPTVVKQEPVPEPVVEQTVQEVIQPLQAVVATTSTSPTATVQSSTVASVSQPITVSEPVKTTETKKVAVKAQQIDMAVVDAAISVALTSASQSVNEQVVTNNPIAQSSISLITRSNNSSSTIQRQMTEQQDYTQQSSMNSDKKDAMDHVILNMLERQEAKQEQKDKALNRGVKSVTELGPEIPLFSTYAQVMLPDSAFYIPKEIYKKQRVIDNVRLLRSLSNDRRYEELLNQQYMR